MGTAQPEHVVGPQKRPFAAFFIVCESAWGHLSSVTSKCDGFHIPVITIAETLASLLGGQCAALKGQCGGPGWAVSQTQPPRDAPLPWLRAAAS